MCLVDETNLYLPLPLFLFRCIRENMKTESRREKPLFSFHFFSYVCKKRRNLHSTRDST